MILDFALVIVLLVCLSLLTSRKKEFLLSLEQNSLATGVLLSAVKMLLLAGLLEKTDGTGLRDYALADKIGDVVAYLPAKQKVEIVTMESVIVLHGTIVQLRRISADKP